MPPASRAGLRPEHPTTELAAPNNVSMRLRNFSFFFQAGSDLGWILILFPCLPQPSALFSFFTGVCLNSPLALNLLASHFESTSSPLSLFSVQPLVITLPAPGTGVWRKSPRLEISSALLPGSQRRAGEGGGASLPQH